MDAYVTQAVVCHHFKLLKLSGHLSLQHNMTYPNQYTTICANNFLVFIALSYNGELHKDSAHVYPASFVHSQMCQLRS